MVYWCLAPTKASCWSSSLSRWTYLLGRSGIVHFQILSRPQLQVYLCLFSGPHICFLCLSGSRQQSISLGDLYITRQSSKANCEVRRQGFKISRKVEKWRWMGGYDRSLRRRLRHHSCQDPCFGVSSDFSHTPGEAMNDPSIYPLRSPWAKVKISPSLMKSSAVWPQIKAVVWGWCGGQGCAYISPNLGA